MFFLAACADPPRSNPAPAEPSAAGHAGASAPSVAPLPCEPAQRTVPVKASPTIALPRGLVQFTAADVQGDDRSDLVAVVDDALFVWDGVPTGASPEGGHLHEVHGVEAQDGGLGVLPDIDGDGRAELVVAGDRPAFLWIAPSSTLADQTSWRQIAGTIHEGSGVAAGALVPSGPGVAAYGSVGGRNGVFVFAPPADPTPSEVSQAFIDVVAPTVRVAGIDLDADGADDLLVSTTDTIGAYAGPLSGDVDAADTIASWAHAPQSVRRVGDLDGDGYQEFGVVSWSERDDGAWISSVFVTDLGAGGGQDLASTAELALEADGLGSFTGVAALGDVDGDDRDDFAVYGVRSYVVPGGTTGTADLESLSTLQVPAASGLVAGLGDVDLDGLGDLLVSNYDDAWFVSGAIAACAGYQAWYTDGDGDGHGDRDATAAAISLTAVVGAARVANDCDDGDARVYPGAIDACGGGTDQDCDGQAECHFGDLAYASLRGGFGDRLGLAVAPAGDVDGDGHADVVAVAGHDDPYGSWSLVRGPWRGGMGDSVSRVWAGTYGAEVFTPLVVGAFTGAGRHDVVWSALGDTHLVSLDDPAAPAIDSPYASSSDFAGADLNGDGVDELVFGAWCVPWTGAYCAHVLQGPVTELSYAAAGATLALLPEQGTPVFTSVGDVDGDGQADLVVGQPYEGWHGNLLPTTKIGQGVSWWWTDIDLAGGAAEAADVAVATFGDSYDRGVYVPVALGDVDGDGRDDVLVHPDEDAGDAYVLAGPGVAGFYADAAIGTVLFPEDSVAAGQIDADGDGAADVVIGGPSGLAIVYGPLVGRHEPETFAARTVGGGIEAIEVGAYGGPSGVSVLVGVPDFGAREEPGAVFAIDLDRLHTTYQAHLAR
jgi:hypothetical protein